MKLFVFLSVATAMMVAGSYADCPKPKCDKQCLSGFRKDSKGCQTCKCVDPCEDKVCRAGLVCKRKNVICKKEPCYDLATCVKKDCPQIKCSRFCKRGYRKDFFGCQTCSCVNPCEDSNPCPSGQICMPKKVQCFAAPCYDVPECFPTANCSDNAMCRMYCEFGFVVGPDGCEICECKMDPCAVVKCSAGQVCEVVNNSAQCVKKCSDIMCMMYCEFGFQTGSDGCPICKCNPGLPQ